MSLTNERFEVGERPQSSNTCNLNLRKKSGFGERPFYFWGGQKFWNSLARDGLHYVSDRSDSPVIPYHISYTYNLNS